MSSEYEKLSTAAVAVATLAAVTLTGIAVVQGFMNTGLVNNDTGNSFITGMTIFATFTAVVALALVGKIVVNIFRKD